MLSSQSQQWEAPVFTPNSHCHESEHGHKHITINETNSSNNCHDSQPLRFCVKNRTSEDSSFPSNNLEQTASGIQAGNAQQQEGWHSERFSKFPQDLDLELIQTNTVLRQVRILVHEIMVPTRIELFVGKNINLSSDLELESNSKSLNQLYVKNNGISAASFTDSERSRTIEYNSTTTNKQAQQTTFRRLGSIELESVDMKGTTVRELKTIFVTEACDILRVRIHTCWPSRENSYNQVGLVGILCLGSALGLASDSSDIRNNNINHIRNFQKSDLRSALEVSPIVCPTFVNIDPNAAEKIPHAFVRERVFGIRRMKALAIGKEDFEAAQALKEAEIFLLHLGESLDELEQEKLLAVAREDFVRARILKTKCDDMQLKISKHLDSIENDLVENGSNSVAPKANKCEQKSVLVDSHAAQAAASALITQTGSSLGYNLEGIETEDEQNNLSDKDIEKPSPYRNQQTEAVMPKTSLTPKPIKSRISPEKKQKPTRQILNVPGTELLPNPEPFYREFTLAERAVIDTLGHEVLWCISSTIHWGLRHAALEKCNRYIQQSDVTVMIQSSISAINQNTKQIDKRPNTAVVPINKSFNAAGASTLPLREHLLARGKQKQNYNRPISTREEDHVVQDSSSVLKLFTAVMHVLQLGLADMVIKVFTASTSLLATITDLFAPLLTLEWKAQQEGSGLNGVSEPLVKVLQQLHCRLGDSNSHVANATSEMLLKLTGIECTGGAKRVVQLLLAPMPETETERKHFLCRIRMQARLQNLNNIILTSEQNQEKRSNSESTTGDVSNNQCELDTDTVESIVKYARGLGKLLVNHPSAEVREELKVLVLATGVALYRSNSEQVVSEFLSEIIEYKPSMVVFLVERFNEYDVPIVLQKKEGADGGKEKGVEEEG